MCASDRYAPLPAAKATFHVTVPRNLTPVFLLTPAAVRWKLSVFVRSVTLMLYVPAASCFTRAPAAVFREIVVLGPTWATSFFTGGGVTTVPDVNDPRIRVGCASHRKR